MTRLTTPFGRIAVAAAISLAGPHLVKGQDAPAVEAQVPASPEPGPSDFDALSLEDLAQRLDSDSFDERQSASEALARRGAEATPLLEKLATEGSREAKSRALDLLVLRAKADGESESKTASRAALERLAKSADAYASRRAEEALAPPPEPSEQPRFAGRAIPNFPNAVPMAPGLPPNIRIQAIAQNAGLRIQRRNENGKETIEVEEGDRKIRVAKTPDGKIEMEVVETKDGKETTEKFAAKDEDDLKKNSPKAHELYKKYAGPGPIQAQIILGNAVPGAFPGGLPQFAPNAPPFGQLAPRARANEMRLESLKRMLETIQRQESRIQEQIDQLEKEIAEAAPAEEKAEKPPAVELPAEAAPEPENEEAPASPENVDREAGSDADGGSDD